MNLGFSRLQRRLRTRTLDTGVEFTLDVIPPEQLRCGLWGGTIYIYMYVYLYVYICANLNMCSKVVGAHGLVTLSPVCAKTQLRTHAEIL